jgi:CRP-like cAMP-binding protein
MARRRKPGGVFNIGRDPPEGPVDEELNMNAVISSKVENAIDNFPLFEDLDDETRDILKSRAKLKAFVAGQKLTTEGDETKDVYLITRGEVEVRSNVSEGEVVLANLGAGHIIGEVSAAMGVPRTSTVTALDLVEVVLIPEALISEVMESNPRLKLLILETVQQRAIEAMQRVPKSGDRLSVDIEMPWDTSEPEEE